jgi:hypothetical protein
VVIRHTLRDPNSGCCGVVGQHVEHPTYAQWLLSMTNVKIWR